MTNLAVTANQTERAAKLAEVINAEPDMDDGWTADDVLAVALSRGLDAMEELHLKATQS
jgi:hypothetical protein